MIKNKIVVDTKKCVGCRICQLTCSFLYYKSFNPSKSRIKVFNVYDLAPIIEFSEECVQCGECATSCLYGALELIGGARS
jgi:carbon-monoxide dehydrogenase iron sulfur subunit